MVLPVDEIKAENAHACVGLRAEGRLRVATTTPSIARSVPGAVRAAAVLSRSTRTAASWRHRPCFPISATASCASTTTPR